MKIYLEKIINKSIAIALILLASSLSGCAAYTQQVQKSLVGLPENRSGQLTEQSLTVYAVQFKQFNNIIRVKKFGVRQLNDQMIEILHGLEYEFELNGISTGLSMEMEMQLKRNNHTSIEDFIKMYSNAAPLFPGSEFKAVPKKLGQILFDLAQRSGNDYDPPSIFPN